MKSFSLDTPDPPKQLLGIDEMPKKKSSSFTNNCFGKSFYWVVSVVSSWLENTTDEKDEEIVNV